MRLNANLRYQLIETPAAAVEHNFRGSPTVLVDGLDPFADAPAGLSCGVYRTEAGLAGSPTLHQLHMAIIVTQE